MRHASIRDVSLLHNQQDFIEAAISLLQQGSRCISIRSAELDPALFDDIAFNEALSAFARRSRYSEVQILVDYPDVLRKRGHRTVDLMRRLSDKIEIRHFYDEPDTRRDSFILTDRRGLLIKSPDPQAVGYFSLTDSVHTQRLLENFSHEWERSPQARQLRQLMI